MSDSESPLSLQTKSVYERLADVFERDRSQDLSEKPWLDQFHSRLPSDAEILDLGCGTGNPVSGYLLGKGARLTGVDYSSAMIDLARKNHPHGDWVVGDIRTFRTHQRFDGIISWDGLFHLSPDEQRRSIPALLELGKATCTFLSTIGPDEGEVTGQIGGETVYHGSLSHAEYVGILKAHGFQQTEVIENDGSNRGRTVLFATRTV